MEEKLLKSAKNGMAVLLATILAYAAAIAAVVISGIDIDRYGASAFSIAGLVIGIAVLTLGWIPLLGLKVLKPQEALVLTLFGKYIGTLKENGFYYVNPFCVGVNPAAKTKLSQSGDVSEPSSGLRAIASGAQSMNLAADYGSKKLSLKIMTLNNSRQKINDCLGNPVESASR